MTLKKPGAKRGAPPHEPTKHSRTLVKFGASGGVPHDAIAAMLEISPNTLRKHYKTELKNGRTEANIMVMGNLFKHATGTGKSAVTAAIFWLKSQAQWRDNGDSASGPPIQVNITKSDNEL